jgi:glutamate synthase domain-containing protein 1
VIKAIANMHDRGNGLGGGFAVYGLYPEHADNYALHLMYLSSKNKLETEEFLRDHFSVIWQEEVPTRTTAAIKNPPLVWRYFVDVPATLPENLSADDYVVARVMEINTSNNDSFVFSSGKNMAVFKGVGYPEEIAEYSRVLPPGALQRLPVDSPREVPNQYGGVVGRRTSFLDSGLDGGA